MDLVPLAFEDEKKSYSENFCRCRRLDLKSIPNSCFLLVLENEFPRAKLEKITYTYVIGNTC